MSNPYQNFQSDRFDDEFDSYDEIDDIDLEYQTYGKPRQNKPWYWMVGCGCLVMMLLCCGICSGLAMIGYQELEGEIQEDLQENPVVKEQIGEIQEMEVQWLETFDNERDDIYVFKLVGDKGSGTVTVQMKEVGFDEPEEIESGTLVLDSGEEFELIPE